MPFLVRFTDLPQCRTDGGGGLNPRQAAGRLGRVAAAPPLQRRPDQPPHRRDIAFDRGADGRAEDTAGHCVSSHFHRLSLLPPPFFRCPSPRPVTALHCLSLTVHCLSLPCTAFPRPFTDFHCLPQPFIVFHYPSTVFHCPSTVFHRLPPHLSFTAFLHRGDGPACAGRGYHQVHWAEQRQRTAAAAGLGHWGAVPHCSGPHPCLSLVFLLPFLDLSLPFHCLSLAFHCFSLVFSLPFLDLSLPVTAFPWRSTTFPFCFSLPLLDLSLPFHCLSLPFHCLSLLCFTVFPRPFTAFHHLSLAFSCLPLAFHCRSSTVHCLSSLLCH